MKKVVGITGISSFWGELLAPCLDEDTEIEKVISFDIQPPRMKLSKVKHVAAHIEDDSFAELLSRYNVDALYHLAFWGSYYYNESHFQKNVMGAMNVLGACAALGIPKVIIKSSVAIYNVGAETPMFIHESYPIYRKHRLRFNKELYDIENFLQSLSKDYPEISFISLRCCHVLGPMVPSPLSLYLSSNNVPVLMGFDPLFQVIHEDDVVRALYHALYKEISGPIHIAPDKPMPLSKILRLTRRTGIPIPHVLAYGVNGILSLIKSDKVLSIEENALRYSLVVDNTRMKQDFGFSLVYTPEQTLAAFEKETKVRTQKSM